MLAPVPVRCPLPDALRDAVEQGGDGAGGRDGAGDKSKQQKKKRRRSGADGGGSSVVCRIGGLEHRVQAADSGGLEFVKHVFVKEHRDAGDQDTLFVANVSPSWDKDTVQALMSTFGKVAQVDLGHVSNGNRFARVKFASAAALKAAISSGASSGLHVPRNQGKARRRLDFVQTFLAERPPLAQLKQESEDYMTKFAQLEADEERKRREQEKQTDDDGFTMVSYRKGARAQAPAVASGVGVSVTTKNGVTRYLTTQTGSIHKSAAEKKKAKKAELQDFYRFQVREKKRDKLAELRSKFEQDKEQLQRLKASRKFKPS